MSDHEFEKQVRQKLDDLRLKPSVESWGKIEDRIRKVGRRPAAIYWMPLLLLMLGGGGYFYFNSFSVRGKRGSELSFSQKNRESSFENFKNKKSSGNKNENSLSQKENSRISSSKNKSENSPDQKKSTNISLSDNQKNNTGIAFSEKKNENSLIQKKSTASASSQNKNENSLTQKKSTNISLSDNQKNNTGIAFSENKNTKSLNQKENSHISSSKNKIKNSLVKENTVFSQSDNIKKPTLSPNTTLNTKNLPYYSKLQQASGNSLKKPLSKDLFNIDNQPDFSPTINLKPKNLSKKWAVGIRASAGVSAVNEGKFIDINRATVEDVAYRASFAPIGYRPPPQYTPSRLTPGFSFSAGVTFQRQLSRKISLNTGLNYLQLNTKNKVGVKVYGNQVVNNGTRGYLNVYNYYMLDENGPSDYMNRYHYLELPVSVSIGLNNSRKLPIFFDAGFAYSRLLGSNSLHFDGTTGVYYKNDRLLNDNQFAFTTGFVFKVFNRTKYPLLIGPSARYNVTRMLQKDVPGNKTFMTLGMDMKVFIW
jgi:hypothetical protein